MFKLHMGLYRQTGLKSFSLYIFLYLMFSVHTNYRPFLTHVLMQVNMFLFFFIL
ncbi:hypothetical protein HanXRQr2_Chr14g0647831 [Helianthus annuus]|uniref:Uncharacterized protein n=1 Tax=Helianthus annuus TaxID=4232 RepID=A0A9K3EBE1_HELAN|nr:hypothetical protein HanXRQr2_Chr14g0647831 [Helianthus annuus]